MSNSCYLSNVVLPSSNSVVAQSFDAADLPVVGLGGDSALYCFPDAFRFFICWPILRGLSSGSSEAPSKPVSACKMPDKWQNANCSRLWAFRVCDLAGALDSACIHFEKTHKKFCLDNEPAVSL